MTLYSFTVVVQGIELDDTAVGAVYGGGLDDAAVREFGGWQLVEVDCTPRVEHFAPRSPPMSAGGAGRRGSAGPLGDRWLV